MSTISSSTTSTTAYKVTADTTGTLVLQTGATPTTALTLSTSQNATFAGTVADSTGTLRPLVSGTAVASTSGTSIDFTGLPSWVKQITVMFKGTSLSGTSNILVQLGTGATTYTTTGYLSTSNGAVGGGNSFNSSTSGFLITVTTAVRITSGHMVITNISGNDWIYSSTAKCDTGTVATGGGDVSLGALLTAVRITNSLSDTFDAGSINILYEG